MSKTCPVCSKEYHDRLTPEEHTEGDYIGAVRVCNGDPYTYLHFRVNFTG